MTDKQTESASLPDHNGYYGDYGGRYISELLVPLTLELDESYKQACKDSDFSREFEELLRDYVGRPSPLYFAENLTKKYGGAKIYMKRDELNHTGAHKINNVLGQILLAKRMGKPRIIAETGAGQHGVATATVCAKFGLECIIFMGAVDIERQKPNVFRMQLLGARIETVTEGTATLKDAMNAALLDWSCNVDNTYYCVGSAAGPHPYPQIVRNFQSIIGRELREQILAREGRLPDVLIACIGGGSNAIGFLYPFIKDKNVKMFAVEAGGIGLKSGSRQNSAAICCGQPGVLHGSRTYVLQTDDGQIAETHSISAGLDYPGVGPEHAWLNDTGRVSYVTADDTEALSACVTCCRLEGILPALEPSHALAHAEKIAKTMEKDAIIVVNVCGRGDKDVHTISHALSKDGNL
jgi:tryptophan synthase beta chain